MKRNFLKWFDTQRNWPFHWGGMEIIAASILSIAILSLGSGMFGKWISAAREGGILPIALHSLVEADYSVDPLSRFVPAIGLEILRDLLGINEPPESEEPLGIVIQTPETPSPTPTATIFLPDDLPTQIDPTEVPAASKTPTQRSTATATQYPIKFYTPTATPYSTNVPGDAPTWTTSPPIASKTPKPTKTMTPTPKHPDSTATETSPPPAATETNPPPIATETNPPPTDTPVIPTSTTEPTPVPPPTLEPSPAITATTRPTHSPTLALTPTTQYTPRVTVGPTIQP